MSKRVFLLLRTAAVLAIAGVAGFLTFDQWRGWLTPTGAAKKEEDHHDHEHAVRVTLTEPAKKNLGLILEPVTPSTFLPTTPAFRLAPCGELVDDAIVDVENTFRRLRENNALPDPRPALRVTYEASVEVRSAIVFGTMMVVLVFLPLFALSGMEGRLFAPPRTATRTVPCCGCSSGGPRTSSALAWRERGRSCRRPGSWWECVPGC